MTSIAGYSTPSSPARSPSTLGVTFEPPPNSPPELVALWKKSEYIRFTEYLKTIEESRKSDLKKELMHIRKIEHKLRQKLVDIESKEKELESADLTLKRQREEFVAKQKRQQDDHASQMKIIREEHLSQMRIEKDKVRNEEIRRKQLEIDATVRRGGKTPHDHVVEEIETKSKSGQPPRRRLPEIPATSTEISNAQIYQLQSELEQALERERIITQSREYFRNVVIRLATRFAPQSAVMNIIAGDIIPVDTISENLSQLTLKRKTLIDTGMYTDTDHVIKEIDLIINKFKE